MPDLQQMLSEALTNNVLLNQERQIQMCRGGGWVGVGGVERLESYTFCFLPTLQHSLQQSWKGNERKVVDFNSQSY